MRFARVPKFFATDQNIEEALVFFLGGIPFAEIHVDSNLPSNRRSPRPGTDGSLADAQAPYLKGRLYIPISPFKKPLDK